MGEGQIAVGEGDGLPAFSCRPLRENSQAKGCRRHGTPLSWLHEDEIMFPLSLHGEDSPEVYAGIR
jgi:hypothetical protein